MVARGGRWWSRAGTAFGRLLHDRNGACTVSFGRTGVKVDVNTAVAETRQADVLVLLLVLPVLVCVISAANVLCSIFLHKRFASTTARDDNRVKIL